MCPFPILTINYNALVADITANAEKAGIHRAKYEANSFKFTFVTNRNCVFSNSVITSIDVLSVWPEDRSSLPVIQAGILWVLTSTA